MNPNAVNQDLLDLIHEVCHSPRVWMTHGDIHSREIDLPNLKVDKISPDGHPDQFALILKAGSIPIFMKPLTGALEDPVASVHHAQGSKVYTITFKSRDELVLVLPESH